MENNKLRIIIFAALCIVINIVGSFLALALRLPVYLDTIGTILSSLLYGPVYGAIVGLSTNVVVSLLFDPTSIYYTPTQIILGFLTGFFFKSRNFYFFKSFWKILIITIVCSITSSVITAFVFNGITSSGSTYLVAALRAAGTNILTSVFSIQLITDLIDKTLAFWISFLIIKILPVNFLPK